MRVVGLILIAASVAACNTPAASPASKLDPTGILLLESGEQVQARPPSEEVALAFSNAMELAQTNGDDLGYPWIEPSSGTLVLSAVTQRGRGLIQSASVPVPHVIRDVAHGAGELRRIQDDATFLRAQGVPGAELIYATFPDHRDNRAVIVISAMSRPLLEYLAEHYPVDALAIEVTPAGGPIGP